MNPYKHDRVELSPIRSTKQWSVVHYDWTGKVLFDSIYDTYEAAKKVAYGLASWLSVTVQEQKS